MISENNQERGGGDSFQRLRDLRFNYSDEIPNERLSGQGNFKVRGIWWQILFDALQGVINENLVSPSLVDEANNFMDKYAGSSARLTTAEDIAEANALIDKILEFEK